MSSSSPCFLKMPARFPSSGTEVSQFPRCPTASFTVSWAAAGRLPKAIAEAVAAASIRICRLFMILLSLSGRSFLSGDAPVAEAAEGGVHNGREDEDDDQHRVH